ncbi:hypothetical protein AURDEDRAFT_166497 [Auricularia subglabra TFB-10046 SS5]|nr:hypothetical protein AURDEDRAFT_166497 [Auricularia subglabra TFB-10046 SS5]
MKLSVALVALTSVGAAHALRCPGSPMTGLDYCCWPGPRICAPLGSVASNGFLCTEALVNQCCKYDSSGALTCTNTNDP